MARINGKAGPSSREKGESPESGDLGYEEARDQLIEVVRKLEAGGTSLEESLALWERGEQLADMCERRLEGARTRLAAAEARRGGPEHGETAD